MRSKSNTPMTYKYLNLLNPIKTVLDRDENAGLLNFSVTPIAEFEED